MNSFLERVLALQATPAPGLLILGGLVFWGLALLGRTGKASLPRERQRWAGAMGVLLLVLGIALYAARIAARMAAPMGAPIHATETTAPPPASEAADLPAPSPGGTSAPPVFQAPTAMHLAGRPASDATPKPCIPSCCGAYGQGYWVATGAFAAGSVITGPAAIHPQEGAMELARALAVEAVPRWGLNVPSGKSVEIPEAITLADGKRYQPEGFMESYANDADLRAAVACWLANCP